MQGGQSVVRAEEVADEIPEPVVAASFSSLDGGFGRYRGTQTMSDAERAEIFEKPIPQCSASRHGRDCRGTSHQLRPSSEPWLEVVLPVASHAFVETPKGWIGEPREVAGEALCYLGQYSGQKPLRPMLLRPILLGPILLRPVLLGPIVT